MEVKIGGVHDISMTEAEYVVGFDTIKEALWLGRLTRTFRQDNSDLASVLYSNSQDLITLS